MEKMLATPTRSEKKPLPPWRIWKPSEKLRNSVRCGERLNGDGGDGDGGGDDGDDDDVVCRGEMQMEV